MNSDGVEASRAPGVQNRSHRGDIGAEQRGDRLEARRERNDGADVEIAIGPAVAPAPDALRERIVDGGMTERALNSHRGDAAAFVEDAGDADHGVELEQLERDGGILEVDLAARDVTLQGARQGVDDPP